MWLLHCLFMVRHDIEVFQTCHFILPVRLCCLRKICGRLKSQVVLPSGSSIPQINSKTQSLSLKALTPSSSFQRLLNSYSGSSQPPASPGLPLLRPSPPAAGPLAATSWAPSASQPDSLLCLRGAAPWSPGAKPQLQSSSLFPLSGCPLPPPDFLCGVVCVAGRRVSAYLRKDG